MLFLLAACVSSSGRFAETRLTAVDASGALTPARPLEIGLDLEGRDAKAAQVQVPYAGQSLEPTVLVELAPEGDGWWSGELTFDTLAEALPLQAPAGQTQWVELELVVSVWTTNMGPTERIEIEVGCDEMAQTLTEDGCQS